MKKKLVFIIILIVTFICSFSLTACKNDYGGKYYLIKSNYIYGNKFFTLDSGYWIYEFEKHGSTRKESGIYTIKGEKIVLTCDKNGEIYVGTVSKGILKVEFENSIYIFVSKEHTHELGLLWEITSKPTCTSSGSYTRSCECGYKIKGTISPKGHKIKNGICTSCKHPQFEYYLKNDGTYSIIKLNIDTIKNVIIPSEYMSIPVTSISFSLSINSSIKKIYIPATITAIDEKAFAKCKNLSTITVNEENPVYRSDGNCLIEKESNKLILGCKTSVIPNGVTSIGKYAFEASRGLKSITLPDSVEYIEYCSFKNCYDLKNITIGNGIKSISTSAFNGCTGLETIEVAKGNKSFYSIGNCLIEKESNKLILGCQTSKIPNGVTSIGTSAFKGGYKFKSVEIPESVTLIEKYAFYDCTNLKEIFYAGTMAQWKSVKKHNNWISETADFTIYCSDDIKDEDYR